MRRQFEEQLNFIGFSVNSDSAYTLSSSDVSYYVGHVDFIAGNA
jgi:hypothetical protein